MKSNFHAYPWTTNCLETGEATQNPALHALHTYPTHRNHPHGPCPLCPLCPLTPRRPPTLGPDHGMGTQRSADLDELNDSWLDQIVEVPWGPQGQPVRATRRMLQQILQQQEAARQAAEESEEEAAAAGGGGGDEGDPGE